MNVQTLINDYKNVLTTKYFCFEGRENRNNFFRYILVAFVISLILSFIDTFIGFRILAPLFGIATILPTLGITARRLHDLDKTASLLLLLLIPVVGFLLVILLCIPEGSRESNQYGDPV